MEWAQPDGETVETMDEKESSKEAATSGGVAPGTMFYSFLVQVTDSAKFQLLFFNLLFFFLISIVCFSSVASFAIGLRKLTTIVLRRPTFIRHPLLLPLQVPNSMVILEFMSQKRPKHAPFGTPVPIYRCPHPRFVFQVCTNILMHGLVQKVLLPLAHFPPTTQRFHRDNTIRE